MIRAGRHRALTRSLLAAMLVASAGCDGSPPPRPPIEGLPPPPPGFSFGYAEERLDVPVGVSLAGYAARYGGTIGQLLGSFTGGSPRPPEGELRPHPYAFLLPPSIGMHTAPRVKAFALSVRSAAGDDDVVLAHVDMVASSFALTDEVVRRVRERTGVDLGDALFLSASHTHSSAGRFADNLLFQSFGGLDSFSPEIFERLARSISSAVEKALRDREPARLGVGIHGGFDPDDLVYHDRRHGNDGEDLVDNADNTAADPVTGDLAVDGLPDGWIKDRRLVVFRFDRPDGSPKAAIVHFPVHGTILTERSLFLSTDSTGMIETKAQERIGVPIAHLQGATGDVQPAEVNLGFDGMERAGEVAAPVIAKLFDSIHATGEPTRLRSAVTTFRSDRQILGYDTAPPPYDAFDAPFGAIGCGIFTDLASLPTLPIPAISASFAPTPFWCVTRPVSIPDPFWRKLVSEGLAPILIDDFSIDSYTDDLLRDIVVGVNPERGPYTKPGFLFTTKMGFLRMNGVPVTRDDTHDTSVRDLAMFMAPGEPTTPWSFETRHKLALALGLAFDDTFIIGYTNDHAGYILNPKDWVTGGGGEIQINPWGPLWGERVRRVGIELAREVSNDQPVPAGSPIEPGDPVPESPSIPTRSARVGITLEPSSTSRFGTVRARFLGGDPIVDLPHVVIEQADATGEFLPVMMAGGRPLDETGYETLLVYDYDENDAANPHLWSFHWELTERQELGRYRFHVFGHDHDGGPARQAVPRFVGAPYELVSQPFEVRPAAITITDVRLESKELRVGSRYPEVPDDSDPNVPDAFRNLPSSPVRSHFRITLAPSPGSGAALEAEGSLDTQGRGTLSDVPPSGAVYDVTLEIRDDFGNGGTAVFRAVAIRDER